MPRTSIEVLERRGKVRRVTLSPEDHRLVLAALAHYAVAVDYDRQTFENMRNRAFEVRDARLRIGRLEDLHKRIEMFDKLEGLTTT